MEVVTVPPKIDWGLPRKLSFEQARQEQRDEAARMTIQERLASMTLLSQQAFVIAPEPRRDPSAAFFVRRPH